MTGVSSRSSVDVNKDRVVFRSFRVRRLVQAASRGVPYRVMNRQIDVDLRCNGCADDKALLA